MYIEKVKLFKGSVLEFAELQVMLDRTRNNIHSPGKSSSAFVSVENSCESNLQAAEICKTETDNGKLDPFTVFLTEVEILLKIN